MPENNNDNNNSNNLFTQMFGLESEQPIELPKEVSTEPLTEPPKIDSVPKPVVENKIPEKPIISPSEELPQAPLFQHDLASELNQHTEPPTTPDSKNNVTTISPTMKEEVIELTNTPMSSEPIKEEKIAEKFDPNAIPKEPFDYVPSSNSSFDEETSNMNFKGPGLKIALVFIGVIILICGWLYFYNIVLNPVENPQNSKLDTEEVEDKEKEEKDEKDEKPVEEIPKINFDQSLSFYKGLVDNLTEVNQEFPYEPTAKTGVIKCELINPQNEKGTISNLNVYLYYEKHLLKKTYIQQITNIKDKNTFNQTAQAFKELEKSFTDNESLSFDNQIDTSTQTIKFGMFSNLAYGSYTSANQSGLILKVKFNYDDNIRKAMSTVYGLEGMEGNIKCSSVKTS